MDHPRPNPDPQLRLDETVMINADTELPSPLNTMSIESILPIANANDLLGLIAQGHCPSDLNRLINHSANTDSRAA